MWLLTPKAAVSEFALFEWDHYEHGLIAYLTGAAWKHRGCEYPKISVTGECCLLFGAARDPSFVSDPTMLLSFAGRTFRANGVAAAEYDERMDLWQSQTSQMAWRAMRVISPSASSALAASYAVRLNPWECPSAGGSLVRSSDRIRTDSVRESASWRATTSTSTKPS